MSRRTPPSPKPAPKTTQRAKKRGDVPRPESKDEFKAKIWALRTEGQSLRQIGRAVQAGVATVWEVLHENPDKLQSLIAAEREERSRNYAQIENRGQHVTLAFLKAIEGQFFTDEGKPKKGKAQLLRREGHRWAAIIQKATNDATSKINLLTGGPTERIAGIGSPDPDAGIVTEESIIDRAIRLEEAGLSGLVALPPVLRARAEAKMGAKG